MRLLPPLAGLLLVTGCARALESAPGGASSARELGAPSVEGPSREAAVEGPSREAAADRLITDRPAAGADQALELVELDASSGPSPGGASAAWTHTASSCPAAECLLVLQVAAWGGKVSGATCNATPLAPGGEASANGMTAQLWYLKSPPASCALAVAGTGGSFFAGATTWRGADLVPVDGAFLSHSFAMAPTITDGRSAPAGSVLLGVAALTGYLPVTTGSATQSLWMASATGTGVAGYAKSVAGKAELAWSTSAPSSWAVVSLLLSPTH